MLVFLKDYIYPPAVELLKQHAEVVDNWNRIGEIDAIIARGTKITADIIEKATNLKVIAKHGIGVNTIDVEAASARGIPVINTPLSNADSVAELTVALFLMLERRLYEANVKSREGSFKTKGPSDFLGNEINGKTFGQIGMGNIAQRIAHIMSAGFGCKVLGYDPFVNAEEAAKRGFEKVDTVEELLERSDLVNVNVPLVKSTHNLVSRDAMRHFKPGSVFVNAARGEVIDEDALYDALVEGRLRAAACDTFVEEPVSPDNKLLTLRNFSATPHLGGNTEEALQKTGMQVVKDTLAVLGGDFSTAHRVN
ncbi:MAG: hydroxyacid dehydrogenase [Oscillospiraceae bacterium]|nr:hydroxyacid dehydrogenase [Oscillospiraceae bacterium]